MWQRFFLCVSPPQTTLRYAKSLATIMSVFLAKEGCATVRFAKSMWTITIDSTRILLGSHIDDFVITYTNQRVLKAFSCTPSERIQRHLRGCPRTLPQKWGGTWYGHGYQLPVLDSLSWSDFVHVQSLEFVRHRQIMTGHVHFASRLLQ